MCCVCSQALDDAVSEVRENAISAMAALVHVRMPPFHTIHMLPSPGPSSLSPVSSAIPAKCHPNDQQCLMACVCSSLVVVVLLPPRSPKWKVKIRRNSKRLKNNWRLSQQQPPLRPHPHPPRPRPLRHHPRLCHSVPRVQITVPRLMTVKRNRWKKLRYGALDQLSHLMFFFFF